MRNHLFPFTGGDPTVGDTAGLAPFGMITGVSAAPGPLAGRRAAGRVPFGMAAGAAAALGPLAGCGGDDMGSGGMAVEMLLGGDGNDMITNSEDAGAIEAGGGDDTIIGAAVAEAIRAGPGNDTIDGGGGGDTIDGGEGDDTIDGGEGDDTIEGGRGDDTITGGAGDDRINGGESGGADSGGFDTAIYEDALTGYRVSGERAAGEWAVFTVLDMNADGGGVDEGEDELTGFEAIRFGSVTYSIVENGTDSGEILIGSADADGSARAAFDGGMGDDLIFGFGGGDTIAGGAGDDLISGGSGGDVISGGAGDDTLYGHTAESNGSEAEGVVDTAVFAGAPTGYRITAEAGDFGDQGAITGVVRLTVTDIDTGGSAPDGGTDTLVGFEALRFDESGSSTTLGVTRTATDSGDILLGTEDSDGSLEGMGGDDLIFGFEGDDVIGGGSGNDIVSGGAGSDTVTGGAGDDALYGHAVDGDGGGTGVTDTAAYADARAGYRIEVVSTGSGGTVLAVRDVDTAARDEGDDMLTGFEALRFEDGTFRLTGTATDSGEILLGTDGNDGEESSLDGMGGDDTVFGFAGDDVIDGGDGDDTIAGGAGDDIIDGGAHDSADSAVYFGRYNGGDGSEYGFQTRRIYENGVAEDILIVTDIGENDRAEDMVDEGVDTLRGVEFLNFADQGGVAVSTLMSTLVEISGDGMDNILEGDADGQRISGDDGDDRILGGGGNDIIDGGAGEDTAVFGGGRGDHAVTLASDGGGADSIEVRDGIGGAATLTNTESIEFADATLVVSDTGEGSNSNDIVYGSVERDTVSGGLGGDLIFGFGGDDIIDGGAGDDVIDGGAGFDGAVYAGALRDFQFIRENGALAVLDARTADGLDEGRDILTNVDTLRFGPVVLDVTDIRFGTGNTGQMVGHATRNSVFYGEGGGYTFGGLSGTDLFQFLAAMDSTSSSKTTIMGFDAAGGDGIALADIEGLRNLAAVTMTDDGGTFTRLGHATSGFELDIRGDHADILDHVYYIGNKPIAKSDAFPDILQLKNGSGEGLPDFASWFEPGDPGAPLSFSATVDGTELNEAGIGLTLSADGSLGGVFTGTSNALVRVTATHGSGERAHGEFTIAAVTVDLDGTAVSETIEDPTTFGRVINGLGGDDTIRGGRGNDTLYGGNAEDGVVIGTDNDIAVYDDALDGYRVWAEWVAIAESETARFTVRDIRGTGAEDEGEDTAVGIEEFRFNDVSFGVVTVGNATGGHEIVVGTNAVDSMDGGGGGDLIFGFNGSDTLNGGPGDDIIMGGGGGDTLDGGAGGDIAVYRGARSDYTITAIRLDGGGEALEIRDDDPDSREYGGMEAVPENQRTDTLVGFERFRFLGDDPSYDTVELSSLQVDIVRGSSDPDNILFGEGDQTITGGAGDDTIFGGAGEDEIDGGEGADTISGGGGADTIAGGAGNDKIFGHLANDHAAADNEIDTAVFAGSVTSYAVTAELADPVDGEDSLVTFTVQDIDAEANGGDDGRDTAVGFEAFRFGRDTFMVVRADRTGGNGGNEIVMGSIGADVNLNAIHGGTGDDLIFGFGGGDLILGGEGDDVVHGGEGDDDVHGGEGGDTLIGGDGDDTMWGGAGIMDTAVYRGDRNDYKITAYLLPLEGSTGFIVEDEMPLNHGDDGLDQLRDIEVLRFIGDSPGAPVNVMAGTATADAINGSYEGEVIMGGDGGQEISGLGGNDTITGGAGMDVAIFRGHIARYEFTVSDLRSAYAGIGVRDTLPNNFASDGTDFLIGIEELRFGADSESPRTYTVKEDATSTDASEILLGTDVFDNVYGFYGDDVIFGFGGRDRIFGGWGDDIIYGGPGGDFIEGNAGDDRIYGGPGPDVLNGGGDDDIIFVEASTEGHDTVRFDNPLQRFTFDVAGDGEIVVEDLANSSLENHAGRNIISLAYNPATSGFVTGEIEFGNNISYMTDNIYINRELTADAAYSDQNDVIRIDSYTGDRAVRTGGGEDTVIISSGTSANSDSGQTAAKLELVDFEVGRDMIAFHPDLGSVGPFPDRSFEIKYSYNAESGYAFFSEESDNFAIEVWNVPGNYDLTNLFYIIGSGATSSASARAEGREEIVAEAVDADEAGGRVFDVDLDLADPIGNSDGDSSPAAGDGFAPDEFAASPDDGAHSSVCGDYLCFTMF